MKYSFLNYFQYIRDVSDAGFAIELEDFKELVAHWLNVRKRSTVWTNNKPDATWLGLFVQRHKLDITLRRCNLKTVGEVSVTEGRLRAFMNRLESSLTDSVYGPLDGDCIINMDETALHWEK